VMATTKEAMVARTAMAATVVESDKRAETSRQRGL
jgi:hypothetical protein